MRLQHVSVPFPDRAHERVRAFYGGLLGLTERDVPPKLDPDELIWFRVGGDLELHLFTGGAEQGSHHFCLVVDEDLDGVRARLEAAGVATHDTTEIVGRPRFFCSDPFGNRIELSRFEA